MNEFLDVNPEDLKNALANNSSTLTDEEQQIAKNSKYRSLAIENIKTQRKQENQLLAAEQQKQADADYRNELFPKFDTETERPIATIKEQEEQLRLETASKQFSDGVAEYGQSLGPDYQQMITDQVARERVGRTFDLLAAENKTPEQWKELFDIARITGTKPSFVLRATSEDKAKIDQLVKERSFKLTDLNTPIVFDIFTDKRINALASDSIQNFQIIEDRMRRQAEKEQKEKEERQQTANPFKSLWYGVGQAATLNTAIRYWVADQFDYDPLSKARRDRELVNLALQVEDLPHDLRVSKLGEEYDKNGLGSALWYGVTNPTIATSVTAQALPTIAAGGAFGRVGTGLVNRVVQNRIANAALRNYVVKATTLGTIGGVSTAGMAYSPNVAQGYQKTGDYESALDRARTQTTVDTGFGVLGGVVPLPTMFIRGLGGRLGNVINVFSEANAQAIAGGAGAYYSAKAVGEEISNGEIFVNFIMGYITTPADIAIASFTGGKQFNESIRSNLETARAVIDETKNMALTGRDGDTAKQVIARIKEQSNSPIQDIYLPAEEFSRYFQEQGIDPAALADQVTGREGALDEALATGTDLQIPLENYAVDIAKDHDAAFADILRTAPDAINFKELAEIETNKDQLTKQIDEAIKQNSKNLQDNRVYSDVYKQLIDIGRFKETAEREALLYGSVFNTLGERLGIDAKNLYDKYKLKLTRDGITQPDSKVYSQNETKANGFIEIDKNNNVRINLTDTANLSTVLHESGHFFLNVLGDVETLPEAKTDIKEMTTAIKKWLKTDNLKDLTVDQHEKFARGFEAYLFEGKSPSIELQGAFTRFKTWLSQIYKTIANLNVRLNDDVRRMFDRLIATDDAIEVAKAPYKETFTTAEQMGVSAKEFDIYKADAIKASEQAKDKLLAQSLKDITREQTKFWKEETAKTKEQVITDLQNEPIYMLDDFLRKGIEQDGEQVIQRLDSEMVKSIYGSDVAKQLRRYTQKDGLHPDVVAQNFGFDSTDIMIEQLAIKPTNEAMVKAETQQRMISQYGDILNDGSLQEKAIQAVESEDGRAKILQAEQRAIEHQKNIAERVARIRVADTKKTIEEAQAQAVKEQREAEKADRQAKREAFSAIENDRVLREASNLIIANTSIKDIKPHLYLQASRKANKLAFDAVQKGEWESAARAKEQERLNHYLYKESIKALDSSDKIVNYAKKFNKTKVRERVNKGNKEGLQQIDGLLEQYEFKEVSNHQIARRESLRTYLDKLASEGIEPDMPEFVIENSRQINYRELSFEELQGVYDSLKAIENVSQLKNKLISGKQKRDFKEFKEEALQSLNNNVPVDARAKATSSLSETPADKVLGKISKHNANTANIITLCWRADGGKADGIFSNSIYKPLRDAELRQRELSQKNSHTLNEVLRGVSGKHFKEKTAISSLNGYMLAKGEAIMIALNSGNASNKSRLLTGGIKVRDSVRALPLTEQAISEVLGTLTKNDWQLVQSIWKMFDDMKPETKELYRTLNGTEFKEVETGTIQTPFGEIKGGYFPLMYDTDVAQVPNGIASKTLFGEGRASALTNNGYTKARQEKATGTVNLDINTFPSKLNEHILDLTHRKALIDANKILTDKDISGALKQKLGVDNYNAMFKAIYDMANTTPTNSIGAWASWLQKNAAVYYLGASLSTMINQFPGMFQLLKYVNPLDYGREIVNSVANFKENARFIMENSPAMADRWRSMDLSNSVYSKLQGKGKIAVTHENIQTIALAYMPIFEKVFSTPAWMAIYKREMGSGKTHQQAIMQADAAVVKSQGGFLSVDKNAYQRNKAIAPFYMFASPFIAVHNSFVDSAFSVRQGFSTAPKEIMINLAIVSLAGFAYSLATGQKDDKDGYGEFYIKSSLSYATAGIPFIRDIVNFTTGAGGRSSMSTPIASTTTNLLNETKKLADPEKAKFDKTVAAFASVTGTPLKPLTVQGAAVKDIVTGDYDPDGFLDGLRHILYRKNKPK